MLDPVSGAAKARTRQGPPQAYEPPPPRGGRAVVAVVLALLVALTVGAFVYAQTGAYDDAHATAASVEFAELGGAGGRSFAPVHEAKA